MTSFDPVAKEYEAGRPDYPDAVFDALEPLDGELVLEAVRAPGLRPGPSSGAALA